MLAHLQGGSIPNRAAAGITLHICWTGQHEEELTKALANAYPSLTELEKLLRFGMDEEQVPFGPVSVGDATYAIVRWAGARGRLDDLLEAACARNQGNRLLAVLRERLVAERQLAKVAAVAGANDIERLRELVLIVARLYRTQSGGQWAPQAIALARALEELGKATNAGVLAAGPAAAQRARLSGDVVDFTGRILGDWTRAPDTGLARVGRAFPPPTKVVVRCKNLVKCYALPDGASFTLTVPTLTLALRRVTAVVGANGSGKSTLLRLIAGASAADGGSVEYPGLDQGGRARPDWPVVRRRLAYVTQDLPGLPGRMIDHLRLTAAFHGFRGTQNDAEVDTVVEMLGLARYRNAGWNEISGGYRTRFALAKALLSRPSLLVLDEPLAHLDVNMQQSFLRAVVDNAVTSESPYAVIITSQHIHTVEAGADEIVYLQNGQVRFYGNQEALRATRTEAVYELACSLDRDALSAVLANAVGPGGELRVRGTAPFYLVRLPKSVAARDVLAALVSAQAEVSHFRDLSGSTQLLLSEEAHGQ